MKQVIHIFKKDVRRFWPVLSILLVLWILHVSPLLSDPFSADTESLAAALYLPNMMQPGSLMALLGLTYCFLGVLLIQEEAPVGTSQFWLTRPIKRWAIPAAKAIFILIFFVGVPVAACGIVLLHTGMGVGNFMSCLPGAFTAYLAIMLLGVLIATLTPTIHYFLLTCIIGIILLTLGVEMLGLHRYLPDPDNPIDPIVWYAVGVPCLLAIFHQYRTRKTVRSAAIFIVGMLAVLCPSFQRWKFDLYKTAPLSAELQKVNLETFSLTVGTREITAEGKPDRYFSYCVVGTAPGESLSSAPYNAWRFDPSVFPGGMGLKYLSVPLHFEQEPRKWLSKGELLVIQSTYAGRFMKKFELITLRMADYTLEAWRRRSTGEISPDRE